MYKRKMHANGNDLFNTYIHIIVKYRSPTCTSFFLHSTFSCMFNYLVLLTIYLQISFLSFVHAKTKISIIFHLCILGVVYTECLIFNNKL